VVVDGQYKLQRGSKVKIVNASDSKAGTAGSGGGRPAGGAPGGNRGQGRPSGAPDKR
jgi:hypothetical protein